MANEEKRGGLIRPSTAASPHVPFRDPGPATLRRHRLFLTPSHAGHMGQLAVGGQRALKTIERLLPRILVDCCQAEATLWHSLPVAVVRFVPCRLTPPVARTMNRVEKLAPIALWNRLASAHSLVDPSHERSTPGEQLELAAVVTG